MNYIHLDPHAIILLSQLKPCCRPETMKQAQTTKRCKEVSKEIQLFRSKGYAVRFLKPTNADHISSPFCMTGLARSIIIGY